MNPETTAFLDALYQGLEGGFLTFTAIHPDKQHAAPSRHVPLRDEARLADTLARLCTANAQGWGAYFSVAPRKADLGRWRRGGRSDLAALPALFVDIDGDSDAVLRQLNAFEFPPSCLVHSGGGLHGYWFIQPTTDWGMADRVLAGLAAALKGDNTHTSQALRVPGTRNTKSIRNGAPCRLMTLNPERRYSLEAFLPFAQNLPPVSFSRRRSFWSAEPDRERLVEAVTAAVIHQLEGRWKGNGYIAARCPYCHARDRVGMHFSYVESANLSSGSCCQHGPLPPVTMQYLLNGAVVGTRNHALFAAACQFRDARFDLCDTEAVLVMRYLADGVSGESVEGREREARATIRSAYRQVRRRALVEHLPVS